MIWACGPEKLARCISVIVSFIHGFSCTAEGPFPLVIQEKEVSCANERRIQLLNLASLWLYRAHYLQKMPTLCEALAFAMQHVVTSTHLLQPLFT